MVIDPGDKLRRFVYFRGLLGAGELDEAIPQLWRYSQSGDLAPSVRIWSAYLAGLGCLVDGKEVDSRKYFQSIQDIVDTDGDLKALFLKQASPDLAGSVVIPADLFRASLARLKINLLAAGLKSWHLGDTKNAHSLLQCFIRALSKLQNHGLSRLAHRLSPTGRRL